MKNNVLKEDEEKEVVSKLGQMKIMKYIYTRSFFFTFY